MVQDGRLPKAHLTMSVCMLVVPPLQAVVKSEVFSGKGASLLSFMERKHLLLADTFWTLVHVQQLEPGVFAKFCSSQPL